MEPQRRFNDEDGYVVLWPINNHLLHTNDMYKSMWIQTHTQKKQPHGGCAGQQHIAGRKNSHICLVGLYSIDVLYWLYNIDVVLIFSVSEYEALDQELDQINSCLDKLENWNDSLQSRMKDMLETMQKARIERQPQINSNSSDSDTQRPQDAN